MHYCHIHPLIPDCPGRVWEIGKKKDEAGAPCHVHGLSPKVSSARYAPAAGASIEVQRRKKRGGERGVRLQEARRGARSGTGFPSFPHPHPGRPGGIPAPQRAGNNAASGTPILSRPPLTTQVSAPLPPAPAPPPPALAMAVPPITGPEAPAAAPASLRATRPRRCAPTAPLAVLLAAPPPAPHRRDPGRTSGRAHRGGRAARRPQTRGAAAASPGPSATAEAEVEEEAGGRRRQLSGSGASLPACGRLSKRG